MRQVIMFFSMVGLFAAMAIGFGSSAQAQTARKFGKKTITVRLCPSKCVAVNGHGYSAGKSTPVYETRGGWARISGYMDRGKLVPSFGDKITKKPALWVPLSSFVSNKVKPKKVAKKKPARKTAAKKVAKKKRVSIVDRVARLRRVPLPNFRPNTNYQVAVSEPVVTQPVIAEPEVVTQPVVAPEPKVEVVETTPVVTTPKGSATNSALTWEQVQAKIAAQKGKVAQIPTTSATPTPPATPVPPTPVVKKIDTSKEDEARRVAEANKIAREAAEKKITAEVAKRAKLAREAEEMKAREVATKQAAAQAKKDKKGVKFTPPKEETEKVAVALPKVVLPPTITTAPKEATPTVAAPKVATPTVVTPKATAPAKTTAVPLNKAAEADPISFGSRPKKMTRALRDKRLRKLPGTKSKVSREVVIALRHYALGLLKSGECQGIAGGGASTTQGMLFVVCKEDPTYQRQFSLKEESW